jgi:cell division septation protein DedD
MIKSRPLAHTAEDDAFHEIQLNGKQLVFLFMVATVVSVVIFLCGVFVGRGVRAERTATVADNSVVTPVPTPDVVPSQQPAPAPAGSDPTTAAPPPAVDELSYFNRLEKPGQPEEKLKPAVATPPPAAPKAASRVQAPPAGSSPAGGAPAAVPAAAAPVTAAPVASAAPGGAASGSASGASALAEPSGAGFALQITALRERQEAESIAKRLSAKGYAAYVLTPAGEAPSVYRVRVGKFKTRREAETMAAKLQKEEQFTPWITR